MSKPRVITNCVAARYAEDDERIVEFSYPGGSEGGLMRLWRDSEGRARLDLYRLEGVIVNGIVNCTGEETLAHEAE